MNPTLHHCPAQRAPSHEYTPGAFTLVFGQPRGSKGGILSTFDVMVGAVAIDVVSPGSGRISGATASETVDVLLGAGSRAACAAQAASPTTAITSHTLPEKEIFIVDKAAPIPFVRQTFLGRGDWGELFDDFRYRRDLEPLTEPCPVGVTTCLLS
jgi:hypothetical protein